MFCVGRRRRHCSISWRSVRALEGLGIGMDCIGWMMYLVLGGVSGGMLRRTWRRYGELGEQRWRTALGGEYGRLVEGVNPDARAIGVAI